MAEKRKYKAVRGMLWFVSICAVAVIAFCAVTNAIVVLNGDQKIVSAEEAAQNDADCILVLGASVLPNGTPSVILQDRLNTAISLYESGAAPKIVMSGDHGTVSYNEVMTMKNYAIERGVPSEDIFCDHAGFSTYESMYRAQHIFGVERMIVVTQKYHMYRALYAANGLGIETVGVISDYHTFQQQAWFDLREIPARTKDLFQTLFKVPFAYDGDPISLDQSGDVTNG